MKLVVHVDGGARGNPGPAAAACVICSADGSLLRERSRLLGTTTNNVAEYEALLLGLREAIELGGSELEIVGDSELVARQVNGQYAVRHEALRPLHGEAKRLLSGLRSWSMRTVPRAQNAHADRLVNAALDASSVT